MRRPPAKDREAGFTLIEALASVAVTAAIVAGLATIVGQWLPRWGHGVAKLQRADLLSLGVERIVADISAAEYVSANGDTEAPLFDGRPSSITFVRSAIGPDSPSRLETVRIAETTDDHRPAAIRFAAPFTPSPARGAPAVSADRVVLVRAPFHVSFAYAGEDRRWTDVWEGNKRLPDLVRVTVRDDEGRLLPESTAVQIRVSAPADDHSKSNPDAEPPPPAATIAARQP